MTFYEKFFHGPLIDAAVCDYRVGDKFECERFLDLYWTHPPPVNDSVLGKRVLTCWENWGIPDYCQMNGFMLSIGNYTFLELGFFAKL